MADRFPAEIWIGGRINAALVAPLCEAIRHQHMELDWDTGPFEPQNPDELLAARVELDEQSVLRLCDGEAHCGVFYLLEQFLFSHSLPYTRRSDGKYEFTAELVDFRPGRPIRRILTDHCGNPMVLLENVLPLAAKLKRLENLLAKGDITCASKAARRVSRALDKALPATLPPLTPLEIVGLSVTTRTDPPYQATP